MIQIDIYIYIEMLYVYIYIYMSIYLSIDISISVCDLSNRVGLARPPLPPQKNHSSNSNSPVWVMLSPFSLRNRNSSSRTKQISSSPCTGFRLFLWALSAPIPRRIHHFPWFHLFPCFLHCGMHRLQNQINYRWDSYSNGVRQSTILLCTNPPFLSNVAFLAVHRLIETSTFWKSPWRSRRAFSLAP